MLAEIGGADRKVASCSRSLCKASAQLGISYRQFTGWSASSASRPGARQPPRLCLCRKARRTMSGLLRTRKIGGRRPLRPTLRPANRKGLVPLCLPKTESPRDFHYDPMDAYRIKFD